MARAISPSSACPRRRPAPIGQEEADGEGQQRRGDREQQDGPLAPLQYELLVAAFGCEYCSRPRSTTLEQWLHLVFSGLLVRTGRSGQLRRRGHSRRRAMAREVYAFGADEPAHLAERAEQLGVPVGCASTELSMPATPQYG